MELKLKTLPPARLAFLRFTGPYGHAGIQLTWRKFTGWCEEAGLRATPRQLYGLCQDEPKVTDAKKCRYDAAIEVDEAFTTKHKDIGLQTFAGGRYACSVFQGTSAELRRAWETMFSELKSNGFHAFGGATLELYGVDFSVDPKTGAFRCELCVPVKLA